MGLVITTAAILSLCEVGVRVIASDAPSAPTTDAELRTWLGVMLGSGGVGALLALAAKVFLEGAYRKRARAEASKFGAEKQKLEAEKQKLEAEKQKLEAEHLALSAGRLGNEHDDLHMVTWMRARNVGQLPVADESGRPSLQISSIRNCLDSLGYKSQQPTASGRVICVIPLLETTVITVMMLGNRESLEITSYTAEVGARNLKRSFLIRLLEAAGDARRCQIGFRSARGGYTILIRHQFVMDKREPMYEALQTMLVHVESANKDVLHLLRDEGITSSPCSPPV